MRIIPVLDLKEGTVVRGMAGRREEYRPIESKLTSSFQPLDVARAFRDRLGLSELYVADLDAIAGKPPALELYSALQELGRQLRVDAGLHQAADAGPLLQAGVERVVAGLETIAGPEVLADLCQADSTRITFSLDMKAGQPLGDLSRWPQASIEALAGEAIQAGVRSLILLDLARVGVGTGAGTEALCRQLKARHANVEIIAGGGVSSVEDLRQLEEAGADAVLVASALHDGRIGPENWQFDVRC